MSAQLRMITITAALAAASPASPATLDINDVPSSDPLVQVADDIQRFNQEQLIIGNGYSRLADQAQNSSWDVAPVRNRETGATMCVATQGMGTLTDAHIINEQGATLNQDERAELRANSSYIMVYPSQTNGELEGIARVGFDVDGDITLHVNGASIELDASETANDAARITDAQAVLTGETFDLTATSAAEIPHLVTRTQETAFPAEAFADCNQTAREGGFDASFDAYEQRPGLIASLERPVNREAEQDLIAQVSTGGMCVDEDQPRNALRTQYMATYIPGASAVNAQFNRDGELTGANVGDLFEVSDDEITRSASLDDAFDASTSGCVGNSTPICVDVAYNGDTIDLTHCWTEPAFGGGGQAAPSAYLGGTSTTIVTTTPTTPGVLIPTDTPTQITIPPIITSDPECSDLFDEDICDPIVILDPTDPIDPISDPTDPTGPIAPVPLPPAGLLLGFAAAQLNRRVREGEKAAVSSVISLPNRILGR